MENYFLNCHSEESIKIRYKKLAAKMHPDKNPKDPEATKNFQEMINQRDEAFRSVYKKSGMTSEEMDSKLRNFVMDLDKLNFSNLNSIAESFAEEFYSKDPDREPTFGEVFSHVLGSLFKAEKQKNNSLGSSQDSKKLSDGK